MCNSIAFITNIKPKMFHMRLIFMGSPDFAVPSLEILAKNFEIVAVVTATDKIGGRQGLIETDVKRKAITLNLPILQPKNLKSEKFQNKLLKLNADLFVVVAFRMLPEAIWSMPPYGTINLHGSLLPAYRGAAPIQRAIMNGETKTGVTTFRLKQQIDTGDMIFQEEIPIGENDTCGKIYNELKDIGAQLLLKTVNAIQQNKVIFKPQSFHGNFPEAPKIFHSDGELDFSKNQNEIHNQVRGLSPYPGAWFKYDGIIYKVLLTQKSTLSRGNILCGTWNLNQVGKLYIACNDHFIEILEIQAEGRRKMSAKDFVNGLKNQKGA